MAELIFLKTENRIDPIGIDNPKPLFSWAYARENGLLQSSYRILVYEHGKAGKLCWDSGDMLGMSCTASYSGRPLKSRRQYIVHLSVRTTDGARAECEGLFETALFNAEDWRGSWITIPSCNQGGALRIRKEFDTLPDGKKPIRIRAYVAGLGFHELYINGKKVSRDLLSPALSDFSKTVYYIVYDLTEIWGESGNTVGILLGHGWLGNRIVKAQFYAEFEDGSVWEDHTTAGSGWWGADSEILSDSVYGGEVFDARRIDMGWTSGNYQMKSCNGWMCAVFATPVSGTLRAQNIEPVREIEVYQVVSARKKRGAIIFDFGVNFAGWARIRVRGKRGARVVLRFAEKTDENGDLDIKNLRSARVRDEYILKGGEVEIWEPRFTYHGFQYVEAKVSKEAELLEISGVHIRSNTEPVGYFTSSDAILNRLHEVAVQTESNNELSILTDCPQRDERFGWLNDLTPRIYQTPYNFGMERFYPKILRDISETQNILGEIGDTAPFYAGARPADPVVVGYLIMGLQCSRLYGNNEILKEEYPHFRAWTESLLTKVRDGVLPYSWYGDWVRPECYAGKSDGHFISTVFLFWHLKCLSEIAERIGYIEDQRRYAAQAGHTRKALLRRYYNGNSFANGTQTENALALELGIVPAGAQTRLAATIEQGIREKGGHSTCGNQGYRPLFFAMTENGYTDLMLDVLTNPTYPGWGYMLACDATTVWERWEKDVRSDMHSYNHPMFASYDAWLYAYLGGIRIAPEAEGAERILIEPYLPKRLQGIACKWRTIRGEVSCVWNKTDSGAVFQVEIPANTLAEISLPGKIVSINGLSPEQVSQNKDRECISAGPGEYQIILLSEVKAIRKL